jgi:GBP family porin
MKKSLMALAVLGALSGAASAQSSVTIYGIVDLGVQWQERATVLPNTTAVTQESGFLIQSGYQSGSRLGFRGSEALGRDWNAVFTMEAGFDASTGTSLQGSRLFGRQIYLGLQNRSLGTFAVGRIAAPSAGTGDFDLIGGIDPFSTGWGVNGLQTTFIPVNSLREDNSIAWASPTWAGFKFGAQYSFNLDLGENVPSENNNRAWNLGANWTWGPLFLAATYDVIMFANCYGVQSPTTGLCTTAGNRPGAGLDDQKMLQVGGSFDFKFLKIYGAYGDFSDVAFVSTVDGASNLIGTFAGFVPVGAGNYDYQAYMVGATIPLFGGSLIGSWQYADAKNIVNNFAQFEPDYFAWGIGYSYPFSRRTNLYIGYGQREWDGTIASSSGVILPNASQLFDLKQFAIGLRHLF